MKKPVRYLSLIPIVTVVLCGFLAVAMGYSRTVSVLSENAPIIDRNCVIIDAGHGGEDGGASSVTGALESQINLKIALRLNDLMHLLGIDTVMIRSEDISVYTTGTSLAAKKVSDLKERVRIINSVDDGLLLSIHQNHFSESRYHGAQVFYANTDGSAELANRLQATFVKSLNPGSNRKCKKSNGVYLMDHIQCTGVLIECGFLSNPEEDARLQSDVYQKKICCVIAATVSSYLSNT